jgi:hypothetical protein
MKNLLLVFSVLTSTTLQAQRIVGPYHVPVDTEYESIHNVTYYLIEDSNRLFMGFTDVKKDVHCIVNTKKKFISRTLVFPVSVGDQKIIDTKGFTVTSITCQEDINT